jgi:chaperonin GroES
MTIVPLYDKVLVQKVLEDEKTEGGLLFKPITAVEDQVNAKVIAVGDGRLLSSGKSLAPKVAVGDIVILGKFAGTKVTHDGAKYLLIREDDILAMVQE